MRWSSGVLPHDKIHPPPIFLAPLQVVLILVLSSAVTWCTRISIRPTFQCSHETNLARFSTLVCTVQKNKSVRIESVNAVAICPSGLLFIKLQLHIILIPLWLLSGSEDVSTPCEMHTNLDLDEREPESSFEDFAAVVPGTGGTAQRHTGRPLWITDSFLSRLICDL